ncbi:MAG: DUF4097 family beta strand repeat-containing protein [Candidatus Aminicenantes bacterium]|nr:DUF4097 family beta strand repeat-containing protein [Candidatus Aminicenantes bacterium]
MKKSIFTLMICLVFLAGAAYLIAAEYQEKFEKALPLTANGSFSLKNTNGDVLISTWTRNEVEIKAVKTAKRDKEDLNRVKIEVSAAGDSVTVDTIYEKTFLRNIRVDVQYEVKVPEGVQLEKVRSTNGDVVLTGRFSDADAGTTNGDVKLESASGKCLAHTTNGDIRAVNFKGPMEASTTNGSIHLEVQTLEAGISGHTTNGSITVKMGGELNANFRAHTTNGRIRTDFPITISGTVSSRRTLEGTLGKGGPEIDLRTTNGSITLTR